MKLLLTGAFRYNEEQFDMIRTLGYDIVFVRDERVPLQFDVSDVEAVVCNGLFLHNDIGKFRSLRFVQLTSVGLDRVPLDYIRAHGIKLCNAKNVYSIPMAEWVVLKILEIFKKSREFYGAQKERQWTKHRDLLELTGKTATIIGVGNVGTEVAKRLKAFGVRLIGVGRRNSECTLLDDYFLIDDIEKALGISDIVILTLPLTEKTRHLINKEMITRMKDNSVLINVSRGGIICETSLIDALENGKFLGVALDVFEEEPLSKDSPLWSFDNVIVSPHNSFVSDQTKERLFSLIFENLAYQKLDR